MYFFADWWPTPSFIGYNRGSKIFLYSRIRWHNKGRTFLISWIIPFWYRTGQHQLYFLEVTLNFYDFIYFIHFGKLLGVNIFLQYLLDNNRFSEVVRTVLQLDIRYYVSEMISNLEKVKLIKNSLFFGVALLSMKKTMYRVSQWKLYNQFVGFIKVIGNNNLFRFLERGSLSRVGQKTVNL